MTHGVPALSGGQQLTLVLLRTLVGWHFLYEGYVKLLHPAWTRGGVPMEPFSSAGYLRNVSGPFGELFRILADPAVSPWLDTGVALGLLIAGLLLILGLFTQIGCGIALLLLAMFYLSAVPLQGIPEPRAEGTYLIVNKNLIEGAAVLVLMAFRTGRIAGLDVWRVGPTRFARARTAAASS
jgi:thiosulfate dehydrogenase [quinone] large subunit